MVAVSLCEFTQADDSLWVESPEEVAFSVAHMTQGAKDMGLTNESFAETLALMLNGAGFQTKQSKLDRDNDMLFLDVIVDGETFYASAGFWRKASYPLPNGDLNSGFVTVWQDYSVGAHYDDPETVRASVGTLIERFITKYSDANNSGKPLRVASAP